VYKIIGADGKEYGPISSVQLARWVNEGRANAQTIAAAEGSGEWKPLASFPEFSLWFGKPFAPPGALSGGATGPGAARGTNGFAVVGLVMGLLSITLQCCCYGVPFNILGVVFSLIALSQIKQNPRLYDGKGVAVAGLVLSLLSLVLAVVLIAIVGLHATWGGMRHHAHRL
jgi:hypothetical protein